jgi:hypothetical protein
MIMGGYSLFQPDKNRLVFEETEFFTQLWGGIWTLCWGGATLGMAIKLVIDLVGGELAASPLAYLGGLLVCGLIASVGVYFLLFSPYKTAYIFNRAKQLLQIETSALNGTTREKRPLSGVVQFVVEPDGDGDYQLFMRIQGQEATPLANSNALGWTQQAQRRRIEEMAEELQTFWDEAKEG